MGQPEIAEKHQNPVTQSGAAASFAGPIRARLAAASREILPAWSSGRPPPPWMAHVQWWWPESTPTAETRLA